MNVIEINNLKKYYGLSKGVEDVSFNVNQGEILGFIGPNGAGKSTVIRTLMGLIKKTSGEVKVFGQEAFENSHIINKNIGYLPSEVILYSQLKVYEQLEYFANIRNSPKNRIIELANELDLDLNKKISQLSFGNRKKVGIVLALMHSPKVIILDEPTSGLDPLIQQRFFNLLLDEKAKGATILLSSHVLREVEKVCDRVALIKDGKIIFVSDIENIKAKEAKMITISPAVQLTTQGLEEKTIIDNQITYRFNGNINELLKELSTLKLNNLIIHELELDDIFMDYYHREDNHD